MSIHDRCQEYFSSSNIYWKHAVGNIIIALENENHPDQKIFSQVGITLMMNNHPGYSRWIDLAIKKLLNDPTSRLDSPLDLPTYDEMSDKDLIEKYEIEDENYPKNEILNELKSRYPLLIQSNNNLSIIDLKEKLKEILI